MAARLQRMFVFAGICLGPAGTVMCIRFGHPAWSVWVWVVMPGAYGLILAAEFVIAAAVGPLPVSLGRCGSLFCAWAGELWAGIELFCWQQPFRTGAQPDDLSERHRGRRGVVLVHGLFCNRGFWNSWMKRFRSQAGIAFIAVDLEPLFGSIDNYLATLDAAVVRITAVTGLAPVLIGHSMGGLVVRRWIGEQRSNDRLHRAVTIGTPHAGTWLARFAGSINGREMAVGSAWLLRLRQQEHPALAARFTCFYSDCDNVVFPPLNATLPGADNRLLKATAHVRLAFRPEVIAEVLHWLEADPPSAGSPSEAACTPNGPDSLPAPTA